MVLKTCTRRVLGRLITVFALVLGVVSYRGNFSIFGTRSIYMVTTVVGQNRHHLPVITIGSVKLPVGYQSCFGCHSYGGYGSFNIIVVTVGAITLGVVLIVGRMRGGTIRLYLGGSTMLTTPACKGKG